VRSFPTPEGEIEIWVKMHPDDLGDLSDLKSIIVGAGPGGEEISLAQVADFRMEQMPGRIERENRRTNSQLFVVYTGQNKEEGRKIVSNLMDGLNYPMGYGWSFGFWTQRENQENMDFVFNILVALFMVYFVMASLFESLAHPFSIMLSLPFAIVGVAWFLYFTNTPFNMMAWIGMMVLIGIVVNNGIVLIDHINNLRRGGMSREKAVIEGCRERLRPIAMTAATTIVGMVPLAFGESSLAGMRYFPMARTIMGGLLASTVLTLIVLPTYYTLVDDFGVYLNRLWFAASPNRRQAPVEGD
jgi:HAE1 family hydrophobic/amphiphilic exporter-1